jgi:hypothetical protein
MAQLTGAIPALAAILNVAFFEARASSDSRYIHAGRCCLFKNRLHVFKFKWADFSISWTLTDAQIHNFCALQNNGTKDSTATIEPED